MGGFLNVDSSFYHWLTKLADRIILNILYVVSCIPVITIGAATAALYNVTGRIQRDEGRVWKDYWRAFRSNFKQATILWLVLLVSGLLIGFSVSFYFQSNETGGLIGILLVTVLFFLWAATAAWVFPLQSRFENTVRNTLKNSLLCGLLSFPKSIAVTVINLIPLVVFLFLPTVFLYLLIIWLMLWFALTAAMHMNLFKKKFEELEKMSAGEV